MNYKFIKNNFIYVILVFLIFLIFLFSYKSYYENFDTCNCTPLQSPSLNYQNGISNKSSSGTIKFDKPFEKIPIVLTQIKTDGSKNVNNQSYSIEIYNVTQYSFDYSKKKIYNQTSGDINIVRLDNDSEQIFYWIAL